MIEVLLRRSGRSSRIRWRSPIRLWYVAGTPGTWPLCPLLTLQAWADYLDRLRAGEAEPGTCNTGAFPQPNVTGMRNANSRLAVPGS